MPALGASTVLANLKNRLQVAAGGPGSGRHPGFGGVQEHPVAVGGARYNIPKGVNKEKVKAYPHPESWQPHPKWKERAYGGVMVNEHGHFLLREPSNHWDGYHWTWPKGRLDNPGEHPIDVAHREVQEETGYTGKPIAPLQGTFISPYAGATGNYYLMRQHGEHDPSKMDRETQSVKWAPYEEAKALINQSKNSGGRKRDLAVLETAHKHIQKYRIIDDNDDGTLAGSAMENVLEILEAGGEGSGCHGPNCGRPAGPGQQLKPAAHLKQMGWQKAKNPRGVINPHTGKVHKTEKLPTFKHPQLGQIHIGQTNIHHFAPTGMYTKMPKGNFGGYLEKLHQTPQAAPKPVAPPPEPPKPVVAPPAPVVAPPEPKADREPIIGLPKEMVHSETGEFISWDNAKKSYTDGHGTSIDHESISRMWEQGKLGKYNAPAPVVHQVPEGMHAEYVKPHEPAWTAKFNTETGSYDKYYHDKKQTSPYLTNITPNEFKSQLDTYQPKPSSAAPAPVSAPIVQTRPEGMAGEYKIGQGTYTYDKTTGKYHTAPGTTGVEPSIIKQAVANIGQTLPTPAPESTQHQVPSGMHAEYVHKNGAWVAKFNSATGLYDKYKDGKLVANESMKNIMPQPMHAQTIAGGGTMYLPKAGSAATPGTVAVPAAVPVVAPPAGKGPNGMPEQIKGPKGGVYKYNSATNLYEHKGGYTLQPSKAQELLQNGKYLPHTDKPTTASGKAALASKIPAGMHSEYIYKSGYGKSAQHAKFNETTGKYDISVGTKHSTSWTPEEFTSKWQYSQFQKTAGAVTGTGTALSQMPATTYTPPPYTPQSPAYVPPQPVAAPVVKSGGPIPSPKVSTTPIPTSLAVDKSMFTLKQGAHGLAGIHEKFVFVDKNNNSWLFKPSDPPVMAHADEAVGLIASALRPGYAIEAKSITMDIPGRGPTFGSLQKMIPDKDLRGEGKFKDFKGRDLNQTPLFDWEVKHLQQEQVLDWLISNHDAHQEQFLRTLGSYVGSRSVIGIDKTQAFKFLGKDELSTTYHPNEHKQFYAAMFQNIKDGKAQFDPNNSFETIKAAEGISREDYKGMLRPYADSRFGSNETAKNTFYDMAIARKENLRADFEKFYSAQLGKKFEFDPPVDPNAKVVVNVATKKAEYHPDSEVRPNSQALIQAHLPDLMKQYKFTPSVTGKHDVNDDVIHSWEKAYLKTDPTFDTKTRWQQAAKGQGLYPELAAKVGLLPSDLKQLKTAIGEWKGGTSTAGAAWIRKAASEIIDGKQQLGSRFAAMVQVEHEVSKAKAAILFPSGHMDSYRGLSGEVGTKLAASKKEAMKTGALIEYNTMGAEGWSHTQVMGSTYMHVPNLPTQNLIFHYKMNPGCGWGGADSEQEFFVAHPNKKQYLKASNILGLGGLVMASNGKNVIVVDGTAGDQVANAHPAKPSGVHEVLDFLEVSPEEAAALQASAAVDAEELELVEEP